MARKTENVHYENIVTDKYEITTHHNQSTGFHAIIIDMKNNFRLSQKMKMFIFYDSAKLVVYNTFRN